MKKITLLLFLPFLALSQSDTYCTKTKYAINSDPIAWGDVEKTYISSFQFIYDTTAKMELSWLSIHPDRITDSTAMIFILENGKKFIFQNFKPSMNIYDSDQILRYTDQNVLPLITELSKSNLMGLRLFLNPRYIDLFPNESYQYDIMETAKCILHLREQP